MKLVGALLAVCAAALASAQQQQQEEEAQGGFYDACARSWSMGFRGEWPFLVATCSSDGGGGADVTSTLNLQDCVANDGGTLTAKKLGYAFSSCVDCNASTTSAELSCRCKTPPGARIPTTIDLNTVVSTEAGILKCFDLPGFEISPPEL